MADRGRPRRRRDDRCADRLPGRHRLFRLLAPLRRRPPYASRGSLGPWRTLLAGLFPGQHRPQGDRRPVPGHDVLLLHARRPDGDVLPCGARSAGAPVRRFPDVQRPRVGARDADDLPLHHPRVRRARELRRPPHARGAGHGVPAPERSLVLAPPDRGDHVRGELPGPWRRVRRRAGRVTRHSPRDSRWARRSSTWASSGPGPRRS